MNLPPRVWELGQYVRVWRGGSVGEHDAGGYEYGHIQEVYPGEDAADFWAGLGGFNGDGNRGNVEVMLVGDDGKEIYCQVKDLEEGE